MATLPTVGLTTHPAGYTLDKEHADIRRGLQNTRQLIIGAIDSATIWDSDAQTALWAALRIIDTECTAAGLPSRFSEDGSVFE